MTTTATLFCPICGQSFELPIVDGAVSCRKRCPRCRNTFLILLTRNNTLAITADLIENGKEANADPDS